MAENKTTPNNASVVAFLDAIADEQERADCKVLAKMMHKATGESAKMWGTSIVGFGRYDYHYDSGREGSFFLCGFAPRARNLAIYILPGFGEFTELMKTLGKHKTRKSCLYINNLADVNCTVLQFLIDKSVKYMRRKYNTGQ